jgi:replicative DNA helicase
MYTNSLEKTTELQNAINYRTAPHNISAEQMILGNLLTNNENLNKIQDFLLAEHFYEPIHQKIYEIIINYSEKGIIATPVTLKNIFDKDPALEQLGGADYLARLASLSTTIINIEDYARIIVDYAVRRELIAIGESVVNDAYDNEIELSASEQIEKAENDLFILDQKGASSKRSTYSLKESLVSAMDKTQKAFKRDSKISGVPTSYTDLDHLLGGLQNSDLLILAGRPSMGKTSFAINIAINSCKILSKNHNSSEGSVPPAIGFFSLEMSAEQLATRMLAMESDINSSRLRTGDLSETDFTKILHANKEIYKLPFYIDDTPSLSISALRTRSRRMKRRHNIALVIVDYLQLLKGSSKSSKEGRVQEISEITQGLKAIAKELDIPVIALSQLSRAVEQRDDKRPMLSDLRESGSIEQDADIVMFIFREEYYLLRKQPKEDTLEHEKWQQSMNEVLNMAEVIIAKQRNGPIGKVQLYFDSNTTKFSNFTNRTVG